MFQIRIRAIVGIMMFLGYFLIYVIRYNLSVHILEMTSILKGDMRNSSTYSIARGHTDIRAGVIRSMVSFDNWRIAVLFSAYHIGYVVCFPIFHNVGDRLGPTWMVGIVGLISGISSCLTPSAAFRHFWFLFTVRVTNGFCAAAMLPSMVQITRHWVPPIERHYFMWAYCGITTGTFCTFLLCAAVQYYSTWCVGYYITGVVQIIWAVVWLCVVVDYPSKHPFITKEEREYLGSTIGTTFTIKLTNAQAPWMQILKSIPFWAVCGLNFGYAWMIISVCIHAPLYYFAVIEYSIYSASALTALPFFLRLLLGTAIIQCFHWYKYNTTNKERLKLIRKYFIVVSHVIPGLLIVSTWSMSLVPGPILLTLAVTLTAAGMDLTLDLCYELSPTFVNSMHTVIKIIGNIPGIIVPLTVGELTQQFHNSPLIWKHIWCFHALMLLLSGLAFLIWGEMQIQPWSNLNRRPPHTIRMKPKPSKMSNIIEVDEEEAISLAKQASKRGSTVTGSSILKPLKILHK